MTGNDTGKYNKEWTVAVFAKTETSSHRVFEDKTRKTPSSQFP
jgi:hypothetical protein